MINRDFELTTGPRGQKKDLGPAIVDLIADYQQRKGQIIPVPSLVELSLALGRCGDSWLRGVGARQGLPTTEAFLTAACCVPVSRVVFYGFCIITVLPEEVSVVRQAPAPTPPPLP